MITEPQRNGKTLRCTICGEYNPAAATHCHHCGTSFAQVAPNNPNTPIAPRPRPSVTQQCPGCGELNRPGIIFCDSCGTNLLTGERPPITTHTFPSMTEGSYDTLSDITINGKETLDVGVFHKSGKSGTSVFEDNMILRLQIDSSPKPLLMRLSQQHPIIIGREDATSTGIDVDMTPHAAYRRGISRRHCAIELMGQRLEIWDLNSSNGTYLNGIRLEPDQRHQLRDSDELRLGQMVIQIFFQQKRER